MQSLSTEPVGHVPGGLQRGRLVPLGQAVVVGQVEPDSLCQRLLAGSGAGRELKC